MIYVLELGSKSLGHLRQAFENILYNHENVHIEVVGYSTATEMLFKKVNISLGSAIRALEFGEYVVVRAVPTSGAVWGSALFLSPSLVGSGWVLWKLVIDGINNPEFFRVGRFLQLNYLCYGVLSIEDTIDIDTPELISGSKFPRSDWRVVESAFSSSSPFSVARVTLGPAFGQLGREII